MLSRDLTKLHVWFDQVLSGSAEFTMDGAVAFRSALEKAAVDAASLEELSKAAIEDLRAGIVRPAGAPVDGNVITFPLRRGAPWGVPFTDGRPR